MKKEEESIIRSGIVEEPLIQRSISKQKSGVPLLYLSVLIIQDLKDPIKLQKK